MSDTPIADSIEGDTVHPVVAPDEVGAAEPVQLQPVVPAPPSITQTPSDSGSIWTIAFWKGTGERALKTGAQTFVAVVGVTGIGSTVGLGDIPWTTDLSITGVAVILSFVTSLGNARFTAGGKK